MRHNSEARRLLRGKELSMLYNHRLLGKREFADFRDSLFPLPQ
jgi:hypothetical protein